MELWLTRAGSHGEFEQKFLEEGRIYLNWGELTANLSQLEDRTELLTLLERTYPDEKTKRLINHCSQIWPFAKVMEIGDWVVRNCSPRWH